MFIVFVCVCVCVCVCVFRNIIKRVSRARAHSNYSLLFCLLRYFKFSFYLLFTRLAISLTQNKFIYLFILSIYLHATSFDLLTLKNVFVQQICFCFDCSCDLSNLRGMFDVHETS